jgi:hypothetical protein
MQMVTHRLDHLVGLTCMEKVGIIGTGKRQRFAKNHAVWLQNLACDPEQNPELIQQIDNHTTLEEVCANQM